MGVCCQKQAPTEADRHDDDDDYDDHANRAAHFRHQVERRPSASTKPPSSAPAAVDVVIVSRPCVISGAAWRADVRQDAVKASVEQVIRKAVGNKYDITVSIMQQPTRLGISVVVSSPLSQEEVERRLMNASLSPLLQFVAPLGTAPQLQLHFGDAEDDAPEEEVADILDGMLDATRAQVDLADGEGGSRSLIVSMEEMQRRDLTAHWWHSFEEARFWEEVAALDRQRSSSAGVTHRRDVQTAHSDAASSASSSPAREQRAPLVPLLELPVVQPDMQALVEGAPLSSRWLAGDDEATPLDLVPPPQLDFGDDSELESDEESAVPAISTTFVDDPLPSARSQRATFSRTISSLAATPRTPRHEVLEKVPDVTIYLDEVDERDVVKRTQAFEWHEILLLENQEGALVQLKLLGRQLLRSHIMFQRHFLMRAEVRSRELLEHEAFKQLLRLADSQLRSIMRRQLWIAEQQRMEQRRAEAADRKAAEAKERRAARRSDDQVKWELQKSRLGLDAAPKPGPRERLFAELAAAREQDMRWRQSQSEVTAAAEKKAKGAGELLIGRGKLRATIEALEQEEARWREALVAEQATRRRETIDYCRRKFPVHGDDRTAQAVREMMTIVKLKQQTNKILHRIQSAASISSSFATDSSGVAPMLMTAHDCGAMATLQFDEFVNRGDLDHQWQQYMERAHSSFLEGRLIVQQHDLRRAAQARELQAAQDAETARRVGLLRIQRAGRNFKVRRALGRVYQVMEEARMLAEDERRDRKALTSKEHILRGDIRQYAALDTMITFKEDAPKVMANLHLFSWNPDCFLVVEALERHKLEELQVAVFSEELAAPFREGVEVIRQIPPHLIGMRQKSARRIQHIFRCFVNKKRFRDYVKDWMVLDRMARLQLNSNLRITVDLERNARMDLVDEERAVDLFGSFREQFMERCHVEYVAARKIQSIARGRIVRQKVIPPLLERHLLRKLQSLSHSTSKPPIIGSK